MPTQVEMVDWLHLQPTTRATIQGAGVFVTAPNGHQLFLPRSGEGDYTGYYGIPGGEIEPGETPQQAALRELFEETGYRHPNMGEALQLAHREISEDGVDFHTFHLQVPHEFTPRLNDEHSGYVWAHPSQAPQPLHPGVASTLAKLGGADCWKTAHDEEAEMAMDPPVSEKQRRAMWAAKEGHSTIGIPKSVGEKFVGRGHDERYALDRASVRSTDVDGRLHVTLTNISKANVCPYSGEEIPDWERLRLDPKKVYQLYRAPDELAKAAKTFNNLPLLSEHVPVSAEDWQPELVVGSTGTDAQFAPPYLRNSLVVWAQDAIDAIESGKQRELSCGYRYTADMRPGVTPDGTRFDGTMRNIVGNHVALVEQGRAGSDVVVGDAAHPEQENEEMTMSMKAAVLQGALHTFLTPKIAKNKKLPDLTPFVEGITSKNFNQKREQLAMDIKHKVTPLLARDANLKALGEFLSSLESVGPVAPAGPPPHEGKDAAAPEGTRGGTGNFAGPSVIGGGADPGATTYGGPLGTSNTGGSSAAGKSSDPFGNGAGDAEEAPSAEVHVHEAPEAEGSNPFAEEPEAAAAAPEAPPMEKAEGCLPEQALAFLKTRLSPDDMEQLMAICAEATQTEEPAPLNAEGNNLPGEAMPPAENPSQPENKEKPEMQTKPAMDAATKNSIKEAIARERQINKEIREAERAVRPLVGELMIAFDSAADVYAHVLKAKGINTIGVHPSAFKTLVEMLPQPGENRSARIAADSARNAESEFANMFPDARAPLHI